MRGALIIGPEPQSSPFPSPAQFNFEMRAVRYCTLPGVTCGDTTNIPDTTGTPTEAPAESSPSPAESPAASPVEEPPAEPSPSPAESPAASPEPSPTEVRGLLISVKVLCRGIDIPVNPSSLFPNTILDCFNWFRLTYLMV
jgi:hypothetical protein